MTTKGFFAMSGNLRVKEGHLEICPFCPFTMCYITLPFAIGHCKLSKKAEAKSGNRLALSLALVGRIGIRTNLRGAPECHAIWQSQYSLPSSSLGVYRAGHIFSTHARSVPNSIAHTTTNVQILPCFHWFQKRRTLSKFSQVGHK